jgi:hypothetical protein
VIAPEQLRALVDEARRAGLPDGPRSDPNAPARPALPRRASLLVRDADGDAIVRRVLQLSGYAVAGG